MLTEQDRAWFYKPNLGDGRFGAVETVANPAVACGAERRAPAIHGCGRATAISISSISSAPAPGFYERTLDAGWAGFRAFRFAARAGLERSQSPLRRSHRRRHRRCADHRGRRLHLASVALARRLRPGVRVPVPLEEGKGPRIVFADGTQSIYLADMSGDGLSDIVRIRNGEVCYWPNRGYGRFGAKVTMDRLAVVRRARSVRSAAHPARRHRRVRHDRHPLSRPRRREDLPQRDRQRLEQRPPSAAGFPPIDDVASIIGRRFPRPRHRLPALVLAAAGRCRTAAALCRSDVRAEAASAGADRQQSRRRDPHRLRLLDRILPRRQGGGHALGHAAAVSRSTWSSASRPTTMSAATASSRATAIITASTTGSSASSAASAGSISSIPRNSRALTASGSLSGRRQHRRRVERSAGPDQDLVPHRRLSQGGAHLAASGARILPGGIAAHTARPSSPMRRSRRCCSTTPSCPRI